MPSDSTAKLALRGIRRWKVGIHFYWRDLWIGVYVAPDNGESQSTFICPVPGVVIEIEHFNEGEL